MADEQLAQETPEGVTIPVPTKADVLRDLAKVAKPKPSDGDSGSTQEQ